METPAAVVPAAEENTVMDNLLQFMSFVFPFRCMELHFMQQAMFALLLLIPLTSAMGVQVVNFKMAFFADAVSHSAFAGAAFGILLGIKPDMGIAVLGVLTGLAIVAVERRSLLAEDTVVGVFFAGVVAFGLAVISRDPSTARDMLRLLYGDILMISRDQIKALGLLGIVLSGFQFFGFNRLLYIGLNPGLAAAHRVRVALYQYIYAALLALVVVFAIQAAGVLLVTALLIVPAAAARNLGHSAAGMFWWAQLIGLFSG